MIYLSKCKLIREAQNARYCNRYSSVQYCVNSRFPVDFFNFKCILQCAFLRG